MKATLMIQKHWFILSGVGILLLLLPFFILSFFSWPSADDLSISFMVIKAGFWKYQVMMYESWTGRYTANFLEALNPLCWPWHAGYKFLPLVMLLGLFFSLYTLFRSIARETYTRKESILATLVLFALILNLFPGISEGIYWMTGAVEYLLASIFSMFCVALLIRKENMHKRSIGHVLHFIIPALLLVLIAGLNEISLLLMLELLSIWIVCKYKLKKVWDVSILGSLMILVGAGIFEISAPGNYTRMAVMSDSFQTFTALKIASFSLLKIFGQCLQSPSFLLLSLLFFPLASRKPNEGSILDQISRLPLGLVLCVSILILFSMYLPQALAMGINPPLRVHGLVLIVMMWLWIINLYIGAQRISRKIGRTFSMPSWANAFLIAVILITTVADFSKEPSGPYHYRGNIARAWSDLSFRAIPYNTQQQQRLQQLRQNENNLSDTLRFKPLHNIPQTIHFIDLTEQPQHWINISYSQYYKTGPVALAEPSPSLPSAYPQNPRP